MDAVLERLRRDIRVHGVTTATLRSAIDDHSAVKLYSVTIRGLDRISLDGGPWLVTVPWDDCDGADVGEPERFDIAAVMLLQDVSFEASFSYTGPSQTVSGKVTGKFALFGLNLTITYPAGPDSFPEVSWLQFSEHTGLMLSDRSVGILNEMFIKQASETAVVTCIEEAMWDQVLPLLNSVLKNIPYPDFS
ncbi:hypothetical protein MTO96_012880 [Rhipicephalus appendiculatus]